MSEGTFRGWTPGKRFGFITPDGGGSEVFLHMADVADPPKFVSGTRVRFACQRTERGTRATNIIAMEGTPMSGPSSTSAIGGLASILGRPGAGSAVTVVEDERMLSEDVEDLDTQDVRAEIIEEIAKWKLEAKAEDNDRYFWHVHETDEISSGDKYFVIGRKGSGKTAICEYLNRTKQYDVLPDPFLPMTKYLSPDEISSVS